jgi:DNA-binding HxlR family transcriptional regulator
MKKRSRPPAADVECIRDVLDGIGNKWSYLILLILAAHPMRFREIRAEIDDISQRALTETLRNLQRDGYIALGRLPAAEPSVRYELTELGQSLVVPVKRLERWAIENKFEILRHRDMFDNAGDPSPIT